MSRVDPRATIAIGFLLQAVAEGADLGADQVDPGPGARGLGLPARAPADRQAGPGDEDKGPNDPCRARSVDGLPRTATGRARFVRNVFEQAVSMHAVRLTDRVDQVAANPTRDELTTLAPTDIAPV